MNNDLENQILINQEKHSLDKIEPRLSHYERLHGDSSLIDIESNCCNFNNHQRNTRRIIINISIVLMNLITMAGIITLLIKK